jgi:hypothetical protein
VRLDGDGNCANLGHAILGRVLRIFINHALALVRLGPELFKESIVDPSISRPRERFCEDAAIGGLTTLAKAN